MTSSGCVSPRFPSGSFRGQDDEILFPLSLTELEPRPLAHYGARHLNEKKINYTAYLYYIDAGSAAYSGYEIINMKLELCWIRVHSLLF
jgi:hypothetical protein